MATIKTGTKVVDSGIYKCTNTECNNEITCVKNETVPPCGQCHNTSFTLVRKTKH